MLHIPELLGLYFYSPHSAEHRNTEQKTREDFKILEKYMPEYLKTGQNINRGIEFIQRAEQKYQVSLDHITTKLMQRKAAIHHQILLRAKSAEAVQQRDISHAAKPVTVFTIPKAFRDHAGIIQRNAIKSWTLLSPRPEIILFGNDEGTADIAHEFGLRHIPDIQKNEYGTPLLNTVFARAQVTASNNVLVYVNADIILMSDFIAAVHEATKKFESFLMVGQRWNLNVSSPINFETSSWEDNLWELVSRTGTLQNITAADYFAFTRYLVPEMPPFGVGRPGWDNWLIYKILSLSHPVIDATQSVMAVHQNHDYSHINESRRMIEVRENRDLAFESFLVGFIYHSTWELTPEDLKQRPVQSKIMALCNDGVSQLQNDKPHLALEKFSEVLRMEQWIPGIYYASASALLKLGHKEEAIDALKKELTLFPYNERARRVLSQLAADVQPRDLNKETFIDTASREILHGEPPANKLYKTDYMSVIVLTSTHQEHTRRCLKSIEKNTPEQHEIIIVPLDSSHTSVKWMRKFLSHNPSYKLIEGKGKTGYARACNRGITESSGEYIVILSDDVEVTDGWLSGMLECLNSALDMGVVGPMSNKIDGPQGIELTGLKDSRIKGFKGAGENAATHPTTRILEPWNYDEIDKYAKAFREKNRYRRVVVKNLNGSCMLFRHEMVEKIGLFDDRFNTGDFADDDFCLRGALEGYKNVIAGDVFVHRQKDRNDIDPIITNKSLFADKKAFVNKWTGIEEKSPAGKKLFAINSMTAAGELNQKGQKESAVVALLEGLKHAHDDQRIHYALAELLLENRKFKDSLDILEAMPERFRQGPGRAELIGYCKEGLNLYEEAERHADEAIALNNTSARAWNLKGLLAFRKGSDSEAEHLFMKALDLDKSLGETYANLGALRWKMKDYDEAFTLLEKAFVLSATIEDIVVNFHAAAVSLSQMARAEKIFRDAAALHPMNKRLKYILADILLQLEKYDEAMDIIEESILTFGMDADTLSIALALREKVGPKCSRVQGFDDSSEGHKEKPSNFDSISLLHDR